jgi:hypothetical protein
MEDEAVIAEMIQIRGIGRWTAEMFLIFNLLRPNVLPLDDLGLLKGISVSYFSGEPVSRSDAREVAANWEPWRTVAPGICGAAWTRCHPIIELIRKRLRWRWCISAPRKIEGKPISGIIEPQPAPGGVPPMIGLVEKGTQ